MSPEEPAERRSDQEPALALKNVSKRFDATQALDGVSLTLWPAEVHALVGENGAGKSTLIKIMTGIHSPDSGRLMLDDGEATFRSSADAQRRGIAAIYQEPAIFPDLSIAENIFIGHRDRGSRIRWKQMYKDAEAILARLDVRLDVRQPARGLSVAQQQAVEIAKAISLDVRVLIMDEPTAALSAHEVGKLFDQTRHLTESGVSVLFISHRLEEVFELADRVTVLRDGRLISSQPRAELTPKQAVKDMVGRDLSEFFARSDHSAGEVVLAVRNLGKTGVFTNVSFEIRKGEVLGLAGLVGAGRTDVALALFGIAPADAGSIELDGRTLAIGSALQAMKEGIAYLSEDRRRLGLALPQSVTANITLATLRNYASRLRLLNFGAERKVAEDFRKKLQIRTSSLNTPVEQLSGGNQQKTMLAKWLNTKPKVLILDEPTRGIDVGAKAEVHRLVDELARSGMAILLISSDLPEILAMSDRIAVLREGQQVSVVERSEATEESIVASAMGAA
ncbi:MAG: sugar ABC transporter ATP-binding protein [Actinomycetota bacterium]